MLQRIWNTFYDFCVIVNTARAANSLARSGHWQEARKLYETQHTAQPGR